MGIYLDDNVVFVEENNLDLAGAVTLKRIIEDEMEKGSESLVISLQKVEKLSGTALMVLKRANQVLKNFKLENVSDAIAEDLKCLSEKTTIKD